MGSVLATTMEMVYSFIVCTNGQAHSIVANDVVMVSSNIETPRDESLSDLVAARTGLGSCEKGRPICFDCRSLLSF